jgi:uncharacterized membrane protein
MRRKNLDLLVIEFLAVLNIVWALLPTRPVFISIILAFPLVFVLPGYTLTEALFRQQSLNASHRLLFSLGLSLALDIVGGFILNILPIGLQALSWAVFLGLLTTVFCSLVVYLRRGAQFQATRLLRFRFNVFAYLLFGLAIVVATLSVLYSIIGVEQQPHPGFTQLWMLPATQNGQGCAVRLGIQSSESTSVNYRVVMTTNGSQATTWPSVVLAPQQEWNRLVPVTVGTTGSTFVEVQLYRLDKPLSVYRQVHLTVHTVKGQSSNTCTSG